MLKLGAFKAITTEFEPLAAIMRKNPSAISFPIDPDKVSHTKISLSRVPSWTPDPDAGAGGA